MNMNDIIVQNGSMCAFEVASSFLVQRHSSLAKLRPRGAGHDECSEKQVQLRQSHANIEKLQKLIFHLDVFHVFLLGEFLLAHSTQSTQSSTGTRMSRIVISEGVTILHPSCNERVPNLTDTFHLFAIL